MASVQPPPRRGRGTIWAVLLALLPLVAAAHVAVVATDGLTRITPDDGSRAPAAGTASPSPAASPPRDSDDPDAGAGVSIEQIVAEGSLDEFDAAARVPVIEVSLPPPPEPEPAAGGGPQSGGSKGGGSKGGGAKSGGGGGSATTYTAFCDGGGGASTTPSSVKGLLDAANAERARLGIGSLSWSSSLASTAASWSAEMAASGSLTHNPNRPSGGENIGYYGPGSVSSAAGVMHSSWMRSTGHCKNIMNPRWSVMGAGVAADDSGVQWFTVNFQ